MTNEEQSIWEAFNTSINEEFLDVRLTRIETELSERLVLFWQQAMSPKAQVLNLLATHELFTKSSSRFDTHTDNEAEMAVNCYSVSQWFDLVITIKCFGIFVEIKSRKTVAKRGCCFDSRSLASNQDYDTLLNNLIGESIEACNTLDKSIEEVNKNLQTRRYT